MKKTRVLHILNSSNYYGIERNVLDIIKRTSGSVNSLCLLPAGDICEILEEQKIRYVATVDGKITRHAILDTIRAFNPDIIHAHGFEVSVKASLYTIGIPILSHLYSKPGWVRGISPKALLYLLCTLRFSVVLESAEGILANTIIEKFSKRKIKAIGLPFHSQEVVNNAYGAVYSEKSDIVFAGRLIDQKDPFAIIELVDSLKKTSAEISAVIAGAGTMRKNLKEAIVERKLENNVNMTGYLKNPCGVINGSKVVCIPSKIDGLSRTAFEALSLGKPVIAANNSGIADIIDESCGVICDDPESMAQACSLLLSNDKLYEEKSANAVEKAKKLDSSQQYFKTIKSIYSDVMEDREKHGLFLR